MLTLVKDKRGGSRTAQEASTAMRVHQSPQAAKELQSRDCPSEGSYKGTSEQALVPSFTGAAPGKV